MYTHLVRARLGNVLAQQLVAAHQLLGDVRLNLCLDRVQLSADRGDYVPIQVLRQDGGKAFGQLAAHHLGDGLQKVFVELTVLLVSV